MMRLSRMLLNFKIKLLCLWSYFVSLVLHKMKMNCVNLPVFPGTTSWSEIAPHGRRDHQAKAAGGERDPPTAAAPVGANGTARWALGQRGVEAPPSAQSHGLSVNLENIRADAGLRWSPRPPSACGVIFHRGADCRVDYRIRHSHSLIGLLHRVGPLIPAR